MVPVLVFTLAMAAAPIRPMPAHVQDPPAQQATLTPQERPMTDAESEALPKGDGRDAVAFITHPGYSRLPIAVIDRGPRFL